MFADPGSPRPRVAGLLALAASLAGSASGCAPGERSIGLQAPRPGLAGEAVPGQFLVGLQRGASLGMPAAVRVVRRDPALQVLLVESRARSPEELREALGPDPAIAFVEPNWLARLGRRQGVAGAPGQAADPAPHQAPARGFQPAAAGDPLLARQWHLRAVNAGAAWQRARGEGMTVAVIDTGVDLDHPDLAGNLVEGANMLEEGTPPRDDDGHGTHVAGIVAAIAGNGVGGAGLAPLAKVMPLRAISETAGSADSISRAIVHAADNRASVINLSLSSRRPSREVERAIEYARWRGSVVVSSAGNAGQEGNPVQYPAAYPGVIAVAALDSWDRIPAWSSHGPWVSLTAPGHVIWSTFPTYDCGTTKWARENPGDVPAGWVVQNDHAALHGTSQAAPVVAAIAALLRSARPDLGPDQVREILLRSARDHGPPGVDPRSGSGVVDAAAALQLQL